jgi:hypothetical protein
MNNILYLIVMLHYTQFPALDIKNPLVIKNPDNKPISFYVVDFDERVRLVKEDAVCLYKVDRGFVFNSEIHELKNGDYLLLYTVHDFAFRFPSREEVDLFTNNADHFTCSLHMQKDKSYFYMYQLHNDKAIEKMKMVDIEIASYKPKNPNFKRKLYRLNDGSYLRAEERLGKNGYIASWFPDLATFEYYYLNRFTE